MDKKNAFRVNAAAAILMGYSLIALLTVFNPPNLTMDFLGGFGSICLSRVFKGTDIPPHLLNPNRGIMFGCGIILLLRFIISLIGVLI